MKANNKMTMTLLGLVATASSASAAVISWNLNDWGDSPTGSASPGTGVVAVGYWNDTWLDGFPAPNPMTDVRDSTGAATTADVSWTSNSGTWNKGAEAHLGADADGTLNREMLYGYVNGIGAAGASVTVSEIPYASYDVYVYFGSDDETRTGTVTDGTTTYSFDVLDGQVAGSNALFAQTVDTGSGNPEANYAVFSGLSSSSLTISTHFRNAAGDADDYGGIAAIQIVEVPEPSIAFLGGLGLLGLLRRRRA